MIRLETLYNDLLKEYVTDHYWKRKKRIQDEIYGFLYLGEFLQDEIKFEALCEAVFPKQNIDVKKLFNAFREQEKKYPDLKNGFALGRYKLPEDEYQIIKDRLDLVEEDAYHENFFKYMARKSNNKSLEEVHLHVYPFHLYDEKYEKLIDAIKYDDFDINGFNFPIKNFVKKVIEFSRDENNFKIVHKNYSALKRFQNNKLWYSLKENIRFYLRSERHIENGKLVEKSTVGDTVMTVIKTESENNNRIALKTIFYERTDEPKSNTKEIASWDEFVKFIEYYNKTGRIDAEEPEIIDTKIKLNAIFSQNVHPKIIEKIKSPNKDIGNFNNTFYLIYNNDYKKSKIPQAIEDFNMKQCAGKKMAYYDYVEDANKILTKIYTIASMGHIAKESAMIEFRTAKDNFNRIKDKMERIMTNISCSHSSRGEITNTK